MGNIGKPLRKGIKIPANEPGKRKEEVPQQVPATPVPEREKEEVPA